MKHHKDYYVRVLLWVLLTPLLSFCSQQNESQIFTQTLIDLCKQNSIENESDQIIRLLAQGAACEEKNN